MRTRMNLSMHVRKQTQKVSHGDYGAERVSADDTGQSTSARRWGVGALLCEELSRVRVF